MVDIVAALSEHNRGIVVRHINEQARNVVATLRRTGVPLPVKLFLDIDDTVMSSRHDESFPVGYGRSVAVCSLCATCWPRHVRHDVCACARVHVREQAGTVYPGLVALAAEITSARAAESNGARDDDAKSDGEQSQQHCGLRFINTCPRATPRGGVMDGHAIHHVRVLCLRWRRGQ
jgi:hypothetical protein